MGLDMYIMGRRSFAGSPIPKDEQHPDYDSARIAIAAQSGDSSEEQLAYWRKHPNLHGYIVQTYAAGVDECQEIPLSAEQLKQVLDATQNPRSLPVTSGFFFGTTDGTEVEDDKVQLSKVIEWLNTPDSDPQITRSVFYAASW